MSTSTATAQTTACGLSGRRGRPGQETVQAQDSRRPLQLGLRTSLGAGAHPGASGGPGDQSLVRTSRRGSTAHLCSRKAGWPPAGVPNSLGLFPHLYGQGKSRTCAPWGSVRIECQRPMLEQCPAHSQSLSGGFS